MISFSTGASNSPKNAQSPAKKEKYSHYEDTKQLEFDTPSHQHLVINNNETAISQMSKNQGSNKGDETNLLLMDATDPDLRYGFTKQPEEDTFTYAGTSYALCKTRTLPTDFCRNKNGEVGVRGIAEVKGGLAVNETLNLGYTEKEGLPIVTVDLARLNQPHIQVLLEKGLISPQLQLQGNQSGVNDDLTIVENWQIVPPKEGFKDVAMEKEVADKIKPTVADWYQQVHPDLLLKEAKQLPTPTLQELGISVVAKPTPSDTN